MTDEREKSRKREIVLDYYEKLIGRWDYAAASVHLGDRFIQHNPTIADGLDGLREFVTGVPAPIAAAMTHRVVRVMVDGDLVMLHGLFSVPGMPDRVIVDLFRLEGDKIIEHWDVMQDVPGEARHANGMI